MITPRRGEIENGVGGRGRGRREEEMEYRNIQIWIDYPIVVFYTRVICGRDGVGEIGYGRGIIPDSDELTSINGGSDVDVMGRGG